MCEICRQHPCHSRCPNYEPPKTDYHCSICDEGIYNGEEYIENNNGEYTHYDCLDSFKELLDFLDIGIQTMDD